MIDTAVNPHVSLKTPSKYSIEFFHIYTDEKIGNVHTKSLEYLKEARVAWDMDCTFVVLIDNYNPKQHILTAEQVLDFLDKEGAAPDYWAFEADVVENAKKFLETITNKRLKKSYLRYIEQHNKFPCSLLTATWYLTRLGVFDSSIIKQNVAQQPYKPATRLVNILPAAYVPVEDRAHELIVNSPYSHLAHYIQDLFYDSEDGRAVELF